MLSSISHQVDQIKSQLEDHGRRIDELQTLRRRGEEDGSHTEGENRDSRAVLDRLQAQIKQNTFKLNSLQSRVDQHDFQLGQLQNAYPGTDSRSCVPQDYHLQRIATPMGFGQIPDCTGIVDGASSLLGSSPFSEEPGMGFRGPRGPIDSPFQSLFPPPSADLDVAALESDNTTFTPHVTPRGVEQAGQSQGSQSQQEPFLLENELSLCRRRIQDLEQELHNKDRVIRNLVESQEDILNKEKEYMHKQEWYEHKMRLLKQDKRRRGETIGKLLKCIDDMKDTGRLDVSRVTEGRAVLNATLASRGWPQEERIRAAVNAVELDRTPRHRPDTPFEQDDVDVTSSPRNEGLDMTSGTNDVNKIPFHRVRSMSQ